MGVLDTIKAFFVTLGGLFGIVGNAQRSAQMTKDQSIGQQLQAGADQKSATSAESAMADALAKSPRSQEELDHRLSEGDY